MKVLITGSRNYTNYQGLVTAINELEIIMATSEGEHRPVSEIVHGGAIGADNLAAKYAKLNGLKETVLKPDYQKHHPKSAPLLRNTDLVKIADCTLALYGPNRNGKGGTADAARKTVAAGKHLLQRWNNGQTTHTAPTPRLLL